MRFGARLMLLLSWFRHPDQKPPVTAELDKRLDDVDRRLSKVLTPERARRARDLVRQRG